MTDLRFLAWRMWYDGGRAFNSRETTWAELPDDGVQVMVLYYWDGNTSVEMGNDSYFQAEHPTSAEKIYGSSMETQEEIAARYQNPIVKRGRWTTKSELEDRLADAYVQRDPP